MSSDGPTSWPTFGSEELDWSAADDDYGPRASRSLHSGPYRAAVPPRIADADLSLPPATVALVTEASAEIARFDGEALGSTTSFAALLLRTEAASSSQIEDLSSSPKAIALAELGQGYCLRRGAEVFDLGRAGSLGAQQQGGERRGGPERLPVEASDLRAGFRDQGNRGGRQAQVGVSDAWRDSCPVGAAVQAAACPGTVVVVGRAPVEFLRPESRPAGGSIR